MFTILGTIQGKKYSISYNNGLFNGDSFIIDMAKKESQKKHGLIGLVPNMLDKDYLSEEIPAACFIQKVIFEKSEINSDWEDELPKNLNIVF